MYEEKCMLIFICSAKEKQLKDDSKEIQLQELIATSFYHMEFDKENFILVKE